MGVVLFFLLFDWAKTQESSAFYIQSPEKELGSNARMITLMEIIEEGLRKNHRQQIRFFETSLLHNNWKNTKNAFWWPTMELTLQTTPQRLGIFSGSRSLSRVPDGSLGLVLKDYTIFNWNKDYLAFLNKKQTYLRDTEVLDEKRRSLRHLIIITFFKLLRDQQILKIKKEHLRHSSFIYRFIREKAVLKKRKNREYYLSRTEYLEAQKKYQEARHRLQTANSDLALLLGDSPHTVYSVYQMLDFRPLDVPLKESIQLARETSPPIRQAKSELINARRHRKIVRKSNLPLPKISVSLGAWKHRFGSDTSQSSFENERGSSSVEMVAAVNASWSLTGEGGMFNSYKRAASVIDQELKEKTLRKAYYDAESIIRSLYDDIYFLEHQMKIAKAYHAASGKAFDTTLGDYTDGKIDFTTFKLSLDAMIEGKESLEDIKTIHLEKKVRLAGLIGKDNLVNENFDNLAVESK